MKKNILFSLALLFLMLGIASALHAGYKSDPWGSKTWTGSDRPPHWSLKLTKPDQSNADKLLVVSDRRIRQERESRNTRGYWRDRNHRRYHQRNRNTGYNYYPKNRGETDIIKRGKRIPVYNQVQRKPTKLQCGGTIVTSKDPKTGVIIMKYVSSARDC